MIAAEILGSWVFLTLLHPKNPWKQHFCWLFSLVVGFAKFARMCVWTVWTLRGLMKNWDGEATASFI